MVGFTCAVPNCFSKSGCGLSLFSFPKDSEKSKLWALACDREDLLPHIKETHGNYKVCENHFDQISIIKRNSRKRLCSNAVPSIFRENERTAISELISHENQQEDLEKGKILSDNNIVSPNKIALQSHQIASATEQHSPTGIYYDLNQHIKIKEEISNDEITLVNDSNIKLEEEDNGYDDNTTKKNCYQTSITSFTNMEDFNEQIKQLCLAIIEDLSYKETPTKTTLMQHAACVTNVSYPLMLQLMEEQWNKEKIDTNRNIDYTRIKCYLREIFLVKTIFKIKEDFGKDEPLPLDLYFSLISDYRDIVPFKNDLCRWLQQIEVQFKDSHQKPCPVVQQMKLGEQNLGIRQNHEENIEFSKPQIAAENNFQIIPKEVDNDEDKILEEHPINLETKIMEELNVGSVQWKELADILTNINAQLKAEHKTPALDIFYEESKKIFNQHFSKETLLQLLLTLEINFTIEDNEIQDIEYQHEDLDPFIVNFLNNINDSFISAGKTPTLEYFHEKLTTITETHTFKYSKETVMKLLHKLNIKYQVKLRILKLFPSVDYFIKKFKLLGIMYKREDMLTWLSTMHVNFKEEKELQLYNFDTAHKPVNNVIKHLINHFSKEYYATTVTVDKSQIDPLVVSIIKNIEYNLYFIDIIPSLDCYYEGFTATVGNICCKDTLSMWLKQLGIKYNHDNNNDCIITTDQLLNVPTLDYFFKNFQKYDQFFSKLLIRFWLKQLKISFKDEDINSKESDVDNSPVDASIIVNLKKFNKEFYERSSEQKEKAPLVDPELTKIIKNIEYQYGRLGLIPTLDFIFYVVSNFRKDLTKCAVEKILNNINIKYTNNSKSEIQCAEEEWSESDFQPNLSIAQANKEYKTCIPTLDYFYEKLIEEGPICSKNTVKKWLDEIQIIYYNSDLGLTDDQINEELTTSITVKLKKIDQKYKSFMSKLLNDVEITFRERHEAPSANYIYDYLLSFNGIFQQNYYSKETIKHWIETKFPTTENFCTEDVMIPTILENDDVFTPTLEYFLNNLKDRTNRSYSKNEVAFWLKNIGIHFKMNGVLEPSKNKTKNLTKQIADILVKLDAEIRLKLLKCHLKEVEWAFKTIKQLPNYSHLHRIIDNSKFFNYIQNSQQKEFIYNKWLREIGISYNELHNEKDLIQNIMHSTVSTNEGETYLTSIENIKNEILDNEQEILTASSMTGFSDTPKINNRNAKEILPNVSSKSKGVNLCDQTNYLNTEQVNIQSNLDTPFSPQLKLPTKINMNFPNIGFKLIKLTDLPTVKLSQIKEPKKLITLSSLQEKNNDYPIVSLKMSDLKPERSSLSSNPKILITDTRYVRPHDCSQLTVNSGSSNSLEISSDIQSKNHKENHQITNQASENSCSDKSRVMELDRYKNVEIKQEALEELPIIIEVEEDMEVEEMLIKNKEIIHELKESFLEKTRESTMQSNQINNQVEDIEVDTNYDQSSQKGKKEKQRKENVNVLPKHADRAVNIFTDVEYEFHRYGEIPTLNDFYVRTVQTFGEDVYSKDNIKDWLNIIGIKFKIDDSERKIPKKKQKINKKFQKNKNVEVVNSASKITQPTEAIQVDINCDRPVTEINENLVEDVESKQKTYNEMPCTDKVIGIFSEVEYELHQRCQVPTLNDFYVKIAQEFGENLYSKDDIKNWLNKIGIKFYPDGRSNYFSNIYDIKKKKSNQNHQTTESLTNKNNCPDILPIKFEIIEEKLQNVGFRQEELPLKNENVKSSNIKKIKLQNVNIRGLEDLLTNYFDESEVIENSLQKAQAPTVQSNSYVSQISSAVKDVEEPKKGIKQESPTNVEETDIVVIDDDSDEIEIPIKKSKTKQTFRKFRKTKAAVKSKKTLQNSKVIKPVNYSQKSVKEINKNLVKEKIEDKVANIITDVECEFHQKCQLPTFNDFYERIVKEFGSSLYSRDNIKNWLSKIGIKFKIK